MNKKQLESRLDDLQDEITGLLKGQRLWQAEPLLTEYHALCRTYERRYKTKYHEPEGHDTPKERR